MLTPLQDRAAPPASAAMGKVLARAMFASPHLALTLGYPGSLGDPVPFRLSPTIAEALGQEISSMEAQREEIDRDVTAIVRRKQMQKWLLGKVGDVGRDPASLSNLLFPGWPLAKGFIPRGARLYGLFETEEAMPPEALFLSWLPSRTPEALWPDAAFQVDDLDASIIDRLVGALGFPEDVIRSGFEAMVCAVPNQDTNPYIHRDRWRNEGWSDVTGLGRPHELPYWMSWPLEPDSFGDDAIFTSEGVQAEAAKKAYDRHAYARADAHMRCHMSELAARALAGEGKVAIRRAALYDIVYALRRVLQPLHTWCAQASSVTWLAAHQGISLSAARTMLDELAVIWSASRDVWCSVGRETSVASLLLRHVAVSRAALLRILAHPGHPKFGHARVALVFFAMWNAQAPLHRLWRAQKTGGLPDPEDLLSTSFYPTWRRVLEVQLVDD
jgi:hypothetical protein